MTVFFNILIIDDLSKVQFIPNFSKFRFLTIFFNISIFDNFFQHFNFLQFLSYLINLAKPETIDERAINKGAKMSIFKRHENLNLAINSAKAIGINVINIDSHIIEEGKRHIILGVIWQIIAIFLFDHMKVQFFPGLISLLRDGETLEDLMKLTPEQLLMRWINFQLERVITYSTGFSRLIAKFLLHIIIPSFFPDFI